nr:hypothetical protein [Pseudomonas fluorescens]
MNCPTTECEMALPDYSTVSILSYSPIAGVRRATGVPVGLLKDADERNAVFSADAAQLTSLTKQVDPKLRLTFGLWAMDKAPSPDLRDRIPLEVMIVHYVRSLPTWSMLSKAPALNIITLDWPVGDSYELRTFLIGGDAPMPPEQLRYFYEQQKGLYRPEVADLMPEVSD